MIRMTLSLLLVVVAILALAWLARRSGLITPQDNAHIRVVASQSLGARSRLVVVDIDGQQRLVLGVTQQHINLIHSSPAPTSTTHDDTLTPSFAVCHARPTTDTPTRID